MARGKKMKQLEVPGTEAKKIPVLDEKCEAYRDVVTRRMALQQEEEDLKADLRQEVRNQVAKGNLQVPPKSETEVVPIYKFTDSEGEPLVLKWGRTENVKVNKAKEAKPAAAEVVA